MTMPTSLLAEAALHPVARGVAQNCLAERDKSMLSPVSAGTLVPGITSVFNGGLQQPLGPAHAYTWSKLTKKSAADPTAPPPLLMTRMTPMEVDVQLQVAELIFRSVLEGKRLGAFPSQNIDDWHREALGEAWVEENTHQRRELLQQMQEDGENTPEWMEAHANLGDVAWEVFEAGTRGERVRRLRRVNRTEVVESFKELFPKVRDSHFARCGAGDQLYNIRACIAVLRLFIRDHEVLGHCTRCLRLIITDEDTNRNALAALCLPMPPLERCEGNIEVGWAFLRAALDAFVVQAGGEPFRAEGEEDKNEDEEQDDDDDDEEQATKPPIDHAPSREVAISIAACIVAARRAPALQAQLGLLREPTPWGSCCDRRELQLMLPDAYAKVEEMLQQERHQALEELLQMLERAGAKLPTPPMLPAPEPAGIANGQTVGEEVAKSIAAEVRELLGRPEDP